MNDVVVDAIINILGFNRFSSLQEQNYAQGWQFYYFFVNVFMLYNLETHCKLVGQGNT